MLGELGGHSRSGTDDYWILFAERHRWPNREHLRPVLMLSAKRVVNSRLAQENARVQREVEDVFLVLQEQIKFITESSDARKENVREMCERLLLH